MFLLFKIHKKSILLAGNPKYLAPRVVSLHVIDVKEKAAKDTENPIHWRLLTSHKINSTEQAWELVGWYKKRWLIEQLFRTAKRGGLDTEGLELTMAHSTIIHRSAQHIFTNDEIKVLEIRNKQRNVVHFTLPISFEFCLTPKTRCAAICS